MLFVNVTNVSKKDKILLYDDITVSKVSKDVIEPVQSVKLS